ncbi:hypothetical protein GSbR_29100 [Geobacter sp. SVR]|nr:hypothetical protein GSbR_29100 [Geobacter sp. SVR]
MDPMKILFTSVSNLTGGLINDMTTLLVAFVCLQFVIFGSRWVLDAFESHMDKKASEKALDDARYYHSRLSERTGDVFSRDFCRAKYRDAIRRAVR